MTLAQSIYWKSGLSSLHYNATLLSYRIFGKCRKGCWRRPNWKYAPYQEGKPALLACDKHVSRGCCHPYGTTVCCEWDRLPLFTGTDGEKDEEACAAEEARWAAEEAAQQNCAHQFGEWLPTGSGVVRHCRLCLLNDYIQTEFNEPTQAFQSVQP